MGLPVWLEQQMFILGRLLLVALGAVCAGQAWIIWQFYALQQRWDTIAFVLYTFCTMYNAGVLVVGALLSDRFIYSNPDFCEQLHRSRYLFYHSIGLPALLQILLYFLWPHTPLEQYTDLETATIANGVCMVALSCFTGFEFLWYPFKTEWCLTILHWKPARLTPKAVISFRVLRVALWAVGLYVLYMDGTRSIAAAALIFSVGHLCMKDQVLHQTNSAEMLLQILVSLLIGYCLMKAYEVRLVCNMMPPTCLAVTPAGVARVFPPTNGARLV